MWKRLLVAVSCAVLCYPASSLAQSWPSKPIRIVVPYSPGGTIDTMARVLQDPLSRALGQPIVVDNRVGAAGAIGTHEVARAAPDGYTLVLGNNGPHSVLPAMSKTLGYDGLTDFAPVSLLGTTPLILIVSPTLPVADLKGFIEYARRSPQPLAFSSSGIGAVSHLTTEAFAQQARIQVLHIPYKGQAPTVMAVATSEVTFAITSPSPTITAYAETGKLKVLGVTTPSASSLVPGVPPMSAVLPGFEAELWYGLLAPAGTDPQVVKRLHDAVVTALAEPRVQATFKQMGAIATPSSPEALADIIRKEAPMWATVIREKGIKSE